MKTGNFLLVGLMAVMLPNFSAASSTENMGDIFKNGCANCHGIKANGVPKMEERQGVTPDEANSNGMASQEKLNIYGPPLNHLSKEALMKKMAELRGKDMLSNTHHVDMMKNLKKIEAREGKVIDEEMAEYIYKTFGSGK